MTLSELGLIIQDFDFIFDNAKNFFKKIILKKNDNQMSGDFYGTGSDIQTIIEFEGVVEAVVSDKASFTDAGIINIGNLKIITREDIFSKYNLKVNDEVIYENKTYLIDNLNKVRAGTDDILYIEFNLNMKRAE